MKRTAQICLMAFILFLSLPLAAAGKERPVSERLNDYKVTGKTQKCLRRFMIKRTEVLNDYTILFHMKNSKTFKSELPYRCIRLGAEKRFSYRLSSALLCDDTIITVFSIVGPFGSCGIGEFEELEEIEEAATPGPGGMFMNRD
jgi:hypothetical protein